MADARHRLAAEGQVDVVDPQRMQARDLGQDAAGLAHQLGPHAVAGQAGHCPRPTHLFLSLVSPCRSARRKTHLSCTEVGVCGVAGRVSVFSP